ncbi:MAG: hypothetical protein IIZ08_02820 [Clostridia bacterium]|nr:hypothetical protein [Clostridia bacterium]
MKLIKLQSAIMTLLILTALFSAVTVHAAGGTYTAEFNVTTSNPDNSIPEGTQFTLKIEGQPHAPLPDPSEIIAEPNGTYQFEPVEFTEPGNYKYTVKQISPEDEKIITEIKEYEINVTVARNDNGDLEGGFTISNQEGSIKYRTISFRNDYKKTAPNGNKDDKSDDDSYNSKKDGDDTDSESKAKKEKSPGTGEPLSPAFGGLALSGILFLIFLIVRKARKGKS